MKSTNIYDLEYLTMAMSAHKGAQYFGVVNPKHMKMFVDVYADQFHG
jgi:hypothetical protein